MNNISLLHLFVASLIILSNIDGRLHAASPQHHDAKSDKPQPSSANLTLQRISAEPDENEDAKSLRWSPDGARVAWSRLSVITGHNALPQREIWTFPPPSATPDPQGAAQPLLLVSAVKITASLSGTGTPAHPHIGEDDESSANPFLLRDFAWSNDHASLLLIGSQSLSWLNLASGQSRLLVTGQLPIEDAAISPDGRIVSFIRNHGLCLVGVDASGAASNAKVRILARSPHEHVLEGELDWPYRNEFHLARAYRWSPDSSQIAFLETDDRDVARYTLRASNGGSTDIAYPKPGGEIPLIRVKVVRVDNAKGQSPLEMKIAETKGYYFPRIAWLPGSHRVAIERLDRPQHTLDLFFADTRTGKSQQILTEKDNYWINVTDNLFFLKDGKRFLWSSERSGFRHLYLYDLQGKLLSQITHGDWEVNSVDGIEDDGGNTPRIFFTATEKSPLERHLYEINLDGTGLTRITQQPGTHRTAFSPDSTSFVDSYSSHAIPPRLALENIPGNPSLARSDAPAVPPFVSSEQLPIPSLLPMEFVDVKLHLGTQVHAFFIKPPGFDPGKKYPVIVYFAGGPGEQLVKDEWYGATGLWMQSMAQQGYIVFALDNQGTTGRGHYFEEPIHMRLGGQEMSDQRDGLAYLQRLPYVDAQRMGVCGWGYGGFLVVHAMLDRPVTWKAGFAGAPIVDWYLDDALFAERYLDDPVVHADGWSASSALENNTPRYFKGPLMVAQGTLDEFVHLENMLTLQDSLVDAGKSAETLIFPDRGHRMEDQPARLLLFTRMSDFFLKNL